MRHVLGTLTKIDYSFCYTFLGSQDCTDNVWRRVKTSKAKCNSSMLLITRKTWTSVPKVNDMGRYIQAFPLVQVFIDDQPGRHRGKENKSTPVGNE